ncbi:UNVERIFIED_CONTAM: Protein FEV [Trichonephila clavipes]
MTPETVNCLILASFDGVWNGRGSSWISLSSHLWQFIIELQAYPRNSNITYWDSGDRRWQNPESETTISYEILRWSFRYQYNKNGPKQVTGEINAYQFHLPGLFKLVYLTQRMSEAEFIQKQFEMTPKNVNLIDLSSQKYFSSRLVAIYYKSPSKSCEFQHLLAG